MDFTVNPPGTPHDLVGDHEPQTIIVRKDAHGNIAPKFIWAQGDLRPNPAWFRATYEERMIIGKTAYLKIEPPSDLHATCP